MKEDKYLY